MKKRTCLLVFGMHRSGTSAFSGLLKQLGIPMGKQLMQGSFDNPKGFFENKKAVELNEYLLKKIGQSWDATHAMPSDCMQWTVVKDIKDTIKQFIQNEFKDTPLFAIKDPRFSLTLPLWQEVFSELNITVKSFILVRHPYEVAGSLYTRNHFAREKATTLWMKYMLEAELHSSNTERHFIAYQAILDNPVGVIGKLNLPIDVSPKQQKKLADQFISKTLKHHQSGKPLETSLLKSIYEAFVGLVNDEKSKDVIHGFDKLRNSATLRSILYEEPLIASLALDNGDGYNQASHQVQKIYPGAHKLSFDLKVSENEKIRGLRFFPSNTLCSLKLENIVFLSAKGERLLPDKVINHSLLSSGGDHLFNKEGNIEVLISSKKAQLHSVEFDLVYQKFRDYALEDIPKLKLENGNQSGDTIQDIDPVKVEYAEEMGKSSFWLNFAGAFFKYPLRFIKHINADNIRILRRALANESPTMILMNLKKLLLRGGQNKGKTSGVSLPDNTSANYPALKNYTPAGAKSEKKWGTILYIFPDLPDFDTSSGGKRALRILELLSETFAVHLFTLGTKPAKYESVLSDKGIKVLKATDHKKVKRSLPDVDVLIFSVYRTFHESKKLTEFYPEAKVIIDTVDIHWVREERSLGIWEGLTAERVRLNKEREIQAYKTVDVIWTVTEPDKQAVLREIPDANIKVVSNVHAPDITAYHDNGTNNLLFIGGYNHYPNLSAVKKLALEIFPQVKAKINDACLIIAGSNAPEEVRVLGEQPGVLFKGYIEENAIEDLYKASFLSVNPLLAGAGVKGKICEAIAYRTPVVTNGIGNEGIDLIHEEEGLVSDIESMPQLIIQALNRKYDFAEMTGKAQDKLANLVGPAVVKKAMLCSIFPEVTICIVTWNRLELLKKCLDSIKKYTVYPNYQIVVYSNACTDGTREYLKAIAQNDEKIIPILADENEVFVRPNNKMMQLFPENDVVLLNNDVEVTKNWLLALYQAAYASRKYGIAGAKLLYPNGVLQEFGSEIYADGSGLNRGKGDNPNLKRYSTLMETGYVSGCAMYIKRNTIRKIGLLDDRYHPCYYEDSDYCYSAKEHGLLTVVSPESIVYHKEGGTAGTDTQSGFKKNQLINRKKFVEKHYGKKNGIKWKGKLHELIAKIPSPPMNGKSNQKDLFTFIDNYPSYMEFQGKNEELRKSWQQFGNILINNNKKVFRYPGRNTMLKEETKINFFVSREHSGKINFRENFICEQTGTSSRLRATHRVIDHFMNQMNGYEGSDVYITEENTPFYRYLKEKIPNLVGSEYLGDSIPFGASNRKGFRNEDLRQLTFKDNSFDLISPNNLLRIS